MKKIILMIILSISMYAVEINQKWIDDNYAMLSSEQKEVIYKSWKTGNALVIDGEEYGYTLATYTFIESSAGRFREGDNGNSVGLTHMGYDRIKELLEDDAVYSGMLRLSKARLLYIVKTNDDLNLYLAMKNFKLNYERWKNYSRAVRAHNGFAPNKEFYNNEYYERFINCMQVIKKVIQEMK